MKTSFERPRGIELEYAIIHCMDPIATDNYDFERLIADGYAYVEP